MEFPPNDLILLLKVRKTYMKDSFMRNGFKSRHDLACNIELSLNPSTKIRNFLIELESVGILFNEGSLKLNLDQCDDLLNASEFIKITREFLEDDYFIVSKHLTTKR